MSSYYSVVRYVPDPVADERINVGVVVFGNGTFLSRFLVKWQRVRNFGGEDISFLHDFSREVEDRQTNLLPSAPVWDEEMLAKIAGRWKNSIQLSEPRSSLQSPEVLLREVSERYLREPLLYRKRHRTKRYAVAAGFEALENALFEKYSISPGTLLKRRHPLQGRFDKHSFDIVMENGKPLLGAEALSFDGPYSRMFKKEVDATLWAVDDVRKVNPKIPLAVLVVPPRQSSSFYRNAGRMFRDLNVEVVTDEGAALWAKKIIKKVHLPPIEHLLGSSN